MFAREGYATLLTAALPRPPERVTSRAELLAAVQKRRRCIAFVDINLLSQLDTISPTVVAMAEGGAVELVDALVSFPALQHVVSIKMLESASAAADTRHVCDRIMHGTEHRLLGRSGIGRAALLTSSERRSMRLERIAEFFLAQGLGQKTIEMVSDIAEELITNALYDAPHEAHWFDSPVPRTTSVELRPEHACEISYGIDGDRAFVRVRDPFGALTQERLLQVLKRCRGKDVQFDESRGGAGLGIWRVFLAASTLVVAVRPGQLTDILVWIDTNTRRPTGKLHTVQLQFSDRFEVEGAAGRFAADHDYDLMDDSFTALIS